MTVVVIGAGPAGLSAAQAVLDVGQPVVVLDAADEVGGQYWRHLPSTRSARRESLLHHDWSTFLALRARVEHDERCELVTSAHVVAVDRAGLHVLIGPPDGTDRERRTYAPDAVVVATGAFDRVLAVPGWELPGVFSAGGAQALLKGDRVLVGERVMVAGAGPFLLPVAAGLAQGGAHVVGVLEANRAARLVVGWGARPWELVGARAKVIEAAGYVRAFARRRVRYATGRGVTAIHGSDRVESVTVSALDHAWAPRAGSERVVPVDAVCLGHGWTPRLEIALALGCSLNEQRFVSVDARQATSAPSIYAAGEVTGVGGAALALCEGAIAGHMAAGGRLDDPRLHERLAQRATWQRFGARLEAAHGIGERWSQWLTPETIVCRCEDVTFERLVTTARSTNSSGLRALKLTSRAGLGLCQGRVCGRTVESLWTMTTGGPLLDDATTDRRPIALPVRLGELAGRKGEAEGRR